MFRHIFRTTLFLLVFLLVCHAAGDAENPIEHHIVANCVDAVSGNYLDAVTEYFRLIHETCPTSTICSTAMRTMISG